jgi:hypothetical protein
MLIAPIDHNREPEPEKQVSRIKSTHWTLPANRGLDSYQNSRASHISEGIILRVRDTRLSERRKNSTEHMKMDRRVRSNRQKDSRWNATTHHILVLALERKAGETELWKSGDRVSVVPTSPTLSPKAHNNTELPANTLKDKPPLLIKNEEDYVLHLSKSYPEKRKDY